MKAADLKPGDVIERCPDEPDLAGWTVLWTVPNATADFWYGDDDDGEFTEDFVVLLKLERDLLLAETRTAWLRSDAEIECV